MDTQSLTITYAIPVKKNIQVKITTEEANENSLRNLCLNIPIGFEQTQILMRSMHEEKVSLDCPR